jgi:hypothetical protein
MCMGTPVSQKELNQIRSDARKRGYIRIYKVVRKQGRHFSGMFYRTFYKQFMKARNHGLDKGFHGFRTLESAERWWGNKTIIECLAKPQWIMDCGITSSGLATIKTSHLCFPKFPAEKIMVREFRALCKKEKH